MAPIKFEEQLKHKLEQRTLPPSSESWSTLSDRLDNDKKKSNNPIYWWLSIAASLVVMVTISVQFFWTDDSNEVMPQVVEEIMIEEQLEYELNDKKSIKLVNENSLKDAKKNSPIIKEPQIIDYKKTIKGAAENKSRVAKNIEVDKTKIELKNTVQESIISSDDAMLNEVIADALIELKSENTVADREIDSLLKVANKELFKDKLKKETLKTVDVDALLMSVEDEMGESFRSKVFEALKESYKTVKTAVAERNN